MQKSTAAQFTKVLTKAKNIAIVTHWSPDGDAMGSSLALYHFLKAKGKNVKVIVPNDYPQFLYWLPGNAFVLNHQVQPKKTEDFIKKADVVFTLDFNSFKRIEVVGKIVEQSTSIKILIDHHQQPDNYAHLYYHDVKACSTCELVYEFIALLKGTKLIDKKIATCLYTGILTDTGSFRFPSTTSKTHKIVADLIDKGADNSTIYNNIHDDNTVSRLKLLGHCLSKKMIVMEEYKTAFISLSEKEQDDFLYQKGDTEGVVNYPLSIKGIKFSAFFAERDGIIKTSFRSKGKFDVNLFARKHFNGGGHKNAAGGKSKESLQASIDSFMKILPDYKKELSTNS